MSGKFAITGLPNYDFVDFAAPSLHEVVDKAVVVTGQEFGDEVVVGRVQLPTGEIDIFNICRISIGRA